MSIGALQWGHDFDVVEDYALPWWVIQPITRLQWGHDFDVVEDAGELVLALQASQLQWGHDFDVVEDMPPTRRNARK